MIIEEKGPSLRETLETVVKTAEAPAPPPSAPAPAPAPVAAPSPAPAAPAPAPVESRKSEERPYLEEKPAKEAAAPAAPAPAPAEEKPDAKTEGQPAHQDGERAPQSWKPVAKSHWDKLTPEVKSEVGRREREFLRVLNESGQARKTHQALTEIAAPFEARYKAAGVPTLKVIQNLMTADHLLSSAPPVQRAQYMARLIKDYQIDIQALDSALSGEEVTSTSPQAQIDQIITQRLAPLQQFVESQQAQATAQERRTEAQIQAEITAMEQDTENYPYFEDVRQEMADIVEVYSRRGVYLSPAEAYNRAVRANPETNKLLQSNAARLQALGANAEAQRSLNASSSVNGSPATFTQKVDPADLRGTIEAAWHQHSGR